MSVTGIEEDTPEIEIPLSAEDQAFAQVFDPSAQYTEVTARRLFEAGVDFVRDGEQYGVWDTPQGSIHPIIVNPLVLPPWMFRDAVLHYLKFLAEQFNEKHQNGDMNTANYHACVKSLETAMDAAIAVDVTKDSIRKIFTAAQKKCEAILNDTI